MPRKLQTPLPIFRSPTQARLLTYLFVTGADRPLSLSALSNRMDIPLSTVQREIDQLERAGLVNSERVGTMRVVYANRSSPYFLDLASLLLKAFGPPALLGSLLRKIPRIQEAYIYGSWARRYHEDEGLAPRDLDVLVIGTPSMNAVYSAARRAEAELDLEVNPIVVARKEWDNPKGIVRRIKNGPLVEIPLTDDT
jgi:DNA-binding transcriptional ArsR family regulator